MSGTSVDDHSLISDFFFQVVFVATAASIVSGTVAERIKFWPFMGFILVLTAVIYPIQGHWSWGVTSLIMISSGKLHKLLGMRGLIAVERLMGMVLVAISVQMLLDGITTYFKALLSLIHI